ncbi:RICIN domain-containing protein [filamentous cyanobacterium LEGE 11480]|uniref:RICIN domain-containing protein n=1 Tax=Romeriopsis navalis LEGE 11480 TaxID=2777977 RepID=A0A928VQM9_9CYAN|nr:RICIN domain-containing protein [Romeriopsis navalis]MBE9030324.1 RICIN domain-containing protein [Romeriopsis navalis LEGE 11480]
MFQFFVGLLRRLAYPFVFLSVILWGWLSAVVPAADAAINDDRQPDLSLNRPAVTTPNTRTVSSPAVGLKRSTVTAPESILQLPESQERSAIPAVENEPVLLDFDRAAVNPAPQRLAQATTCAVLDTNSYYRLTAKHSGKSLDVFGGSQDNGAKLIQWPYGGGANQQWQLNSKGGGYYSIAARHSQKNADVNAGSKENGAKLIQWRAHQGGNQQWCFKPVGGGYYNVVARHSQKNIDVPAASKANGTQLVQWSRNNGAHQQWKLTAVDSIPQPPPPTQKGQWSKKIEFPSVPVAAAVMPNGKVMTWSSYDRNTFVGNKGQQQTYTAIFDPSNNRVQERLVTNTNHDMFCPGTAMLKDGRLLVNGGGPTVTSTSIFDSRNNRWTKSANMAQRRWYNTSVALPNGEVFTIGGNRTSKLDGRGEVWNASRGWRTLTGALMNPFYSGVSMNRAEEHPRLMVAPNGKLFGAGPTPNMNWYDLKGNGSSQSAGKRGNDQFNQNGVYVMYDVGKVLSAGGNPNYDAQNSRSAPSSKATYTIDINRGAQAQQVQSMRYPRAFANGVVMPDGKVLVVGGLNNGKAFSDNGAILAPEMFDPKTNAWSTMANMATPRTYHSVAMLLPDGRVFAGGGGLCGTCNVNHSDAEIYSPPYLFNGQRPTISSAPASVRYQRDFTVRASNDVTDFSLIRLSSVTHSINTDQRFKRVSFKKNGGRYTLNLQSNANITPPGYYMLFGLNRQGVPSVSKIMKVG